MRYSCCFFAGFSAKFYQPLAIRILLCWFWLRLELFESIQLFLVQILHRRISRYSFIDRHQWSTPNMIFFCHCPVGCLYCSRIFRRADGTFPSRIEYIIVGVELLTTLIDNNILDACRSQSGEVVSKRTLGHLCLGCSATLLIEPRELKADIRLATARLQMRLLKLGHIRSIMLENLVLERALRLVLMLALKLVRELTSLKLLLRHGMIWVYQVFVLGRKCHCDVLTRLGLYLLLGHLDIGRDRFSDGVYIYDLFN